jgi:hypothetical protein
MPDEQKPLDTSEPAQAARRQAMQARLAEAKVGSVSELSPLFGKPIAYDGVAGTICYVDDKGERFACDLSDGRRPWGSTAGLVEADGAFTFTTPKPAGGE